jgi:hypothetical protein
MMLRKRQRMKIISKWNFLGKTMTQTRVVVMVDMD